MKRGSSGLSGIVAVDKPAGMTSHDVVDACRRAFSERRVGHAGTLDPAATGLLVVAIGPATRLLPYLTGHDKRYLAHIVFGYETTTDDAEGDPTATAEVPEEVLDPFFATSFVASLIGAHEQLPPAFSAIRIDGEHAYEAARRGESIELEERAIEVLDASLTGVGEDRAGRAFWDVDFTVSKGTYIRAIARDIGRALDTCAHLGGLRRLASGNTTIDAAVSLENLRDLGGDPQMRDALWIDPASALGFPVLQVGKDEMDDIACGRPIVCPAQLAARPVAAHGSLEADAGNGYVSLVAAERLLAIYKFECGVKGGMLRPATVIPGGVVKCRIQAAR